jgi:membrane protein
MEKNSDKQREGQTPRPGKNQNDRGRMAEKPSQIPMKGWRDIALRVKAQLATDNINIVAAGVAFYGFLALFPTMAAMLSLYGLIVDPHAVEQQLAQLATILPPDGQRMVQQILSQIAARPAQALGLGLVLSIIISLWSANTGMSALFKGINIAYDEEDKRSFIQANAMTLLFTVLGLVLLWVSLVLVVLLPAALVNAGLPYTLQVILGGVRWLALAILILFALTVLYRYAPQRANPQWRWVSWGATIAAVLWLVGSALFSLYVSNFGSYNKTYGTFAAVVILLLWFQLTSFIILLGAEINSEMELQTKKDTTGKQKPMGERGAQAADHLGPTPKGPLG